ncbi:hypothetical protein [Halobacillus campisalis]|uniref:RNA polymerase sigma-70 region 4 domain-containing protein n=1 Tax=Halobacillus campisalis TaxID=435909 RepID=A0ABW2K9X4_9BACI|nr:hypothetical protein [Halobacillus campisalis]
MVNLSNITKNDAAYYESMVGSGGNTSKKSLYDRCPFYELLKDRNSEEYKMFIKVYKTMQYILLDREKLVLNKIYGVDCDIKILSKIAKEINVTPERVRQIRYKANVKILRELREIKIE